MAEAAADDLLQQGRSVLGGLVGMAAADVAFVESAQAALVALLTGWRLPAGLPRGLPARRVRAERRPAARPRPAPRAATGRRDRPGRRRGASSACWPTTRRAFVHLTHIGSHRGLLQPAAEIAVLCRAAGVPLVLDAAQSLGHVDVDLGADVVYSTSRKWLAGPRGVGMLFVRPALAAQLTPVLPEPEGEPPLRAFESGEAHVAGRVGLVVAVGRPPGGRPRPGAGAAGGAGPRDPRDRSTGPAAGRVVEPVDEPTATTTLRPAGRRRRRRHPCAAAQRPRHRDHARSARSARPAR